MKIFISFFLFFISTKIYCQDFTYPTDFVWQFSSGLQIKEQTEPTTPSLDYGHVFGKNDGKIYYKNDAGVVYDLTSGGAGSVTSFSFTDGSGFDGTVLNSTTTPTLSLTTTLTQGSVFFAGASGAINEDNTNLFYDNTNDRLGVGTNSPNQQLEITKNFRFPSTTGSNVGVIYKDGDRFIHTYKAGGTNENLFIGNNAGNFTLSAAFNSNNNLGIGSDALGMLTSGYFNTAIGIYSGISITTGFQNTFLGQASGFSNTTGNSNTFIGNVSGVTNETGSSNTFVGSNSGLNIISGNSNSLLGAFAGEDITTGSNNTFVGASAGSTTTTGSNNIVIGVSENTSSSTASNEINIGGVYGGNTSTNVPKFLGSLTTDNSNTKILAKDPVSFEIEEMDVSTLGSGTVTSFSSGNLSPLFTTSVTNPTTTPALSYTLSNVADNTWFGNISGSSAPPTFNAIGAMSRTNDVNVTLSLIGTPAGSLFSNVNLMLGWTGQLSIARGGTGLGSLGTANQLLRVNAGATALEYFTPTYLTTEVDGSTTNEIQNLSYDAANHEVDITLGGASAVIPLADDDGVTEGLASFDNTTFDVDATGNVTVANNGIALGTQTTGSYAAGDAEAGAATNIQDGLIVNADINATAAIDISKLAASTISGVALGNNLANLTATDATLTFSGAYNGSTARTIGLNLNNANTWTAKPTIQLTTEQLRLGYDGSNYVSSTVNSAGGITYDAIGTTPQFIFNDRITLNNSDPAQVALSIQAASAQSQKILEVTDFGGSNTFCKIGSTGKFDVSRNANDGTPSLYVANQNASFTGVLQGWLLGAGTVAEMNYKGRLNKYNGITTANNGALTSVGTPVHLTGQSAAIGATTLYTADEDGFYAIYWNAAVTTAATTSSTLGDFRISYNNGSDGVTKQTTTVNNITRNTGNTTATCISGVYTVYADSGSNIQYSMNYTSSGGTAMQYSLDITIVKL